MIDQVEKQDLTPFSEGLVNNHQICAKTIGHGMEPTVFRTANGGRGSAARAQIP